MKKLVGVLGFCSIFFAAPAQSQGVNPQNENISKTELAKRDCVIMKDSMLMIVLHGQTRMMLDNFLKLSNGTTVLISGIVKMADGTTRVFQEGQYIDMDGNMGMIAGWFKKTGMYE
jgi:hypothetical protein